MTLVAFTMLSVLSIAKTPIDPPTKKIKDSNYLEHYYPCHPAGDIYPCSHPLHSTGDARPCTHYDAWGNRIHTFDIYPCIHPLHSIGDVYPCTHVCY